MGEARQNRPGGDPLSRAEVQQLVSRYGLKRAGARESLSTYTSELWNRRHFVVEFARATNASGYSRSFLGQSWQVLTPLLNAGVYYLLFGLLLKASRGVPNYISYLVIGMFVFQFIQGTLDGGARSLQSNLSLARTLRFPRAVFPISATAIALQQMLMSLVVLVPIVVLTGEPIRLQWLEVIPALVLQSLFCVGLAFLFARIGAKVPDVSQMLPFVMRVWLYASGVMYSITQVTAHMNPLVGKILGVNPAAEFMDLYRGALLASGPSSTLGEWFSAFAWTVVVLVGGYVFFWKAEEEYGRD
ncbi:ABC transporter permease [Leekyejoonella antrihumi]|uniref:Transport permease protein n=1 Tax=Leekyejoonella antrihumi TaxID=1660198 RepID=A0A563E0B5_9MICO|nr:ABC transporter permease [Leekyejoonella antrihumi]